MRLSISELTVGDQVGIARFGNCGSMSEGIYLVEKIDKVKVVVKRGDLERHFSVKKGTELARTGRSASRDTFLEPASDTKDREELRNLERNIAMAWQTLAGAVDRKNLKDTKAAIEEVSVALSRIAK